VRSLHFVNPNFLHFVLANQLAIVASLVAFLGLLLFLRGLILFARKRVRKPVPSIAVSAAAPGLATVSGAATGARTLAAPITGEACFAYRTTIYQRDSKRSGWKNVAEESGHLTFQVEDLTGKLSVEPAGAELDLRQCFREEYAPFSKGDPSHHAIPAHIFTFLARNGVAPDRATCVEECCLRPTSPVFVTATIIENVLAPAPEPTAPPREESPRSRTTPEPTQSDSNPNLAALVAVPEVIRLSSGAAPSSTVHMTQQAKIAAALSRAGLANADLWSSAEPSPPPASEEKAPLDRDAALQALASSIDSIVVNGHPLHDSVPDSTPPSRFTMMKGPDDSTFVISNHDRTSQPALGWQSVLLVMLGTTLTTAGLAIFLLRQRLYWLWQ